MKKTSLLISFAFTCGLILCGCNDGSSSSTEEVHVVKKHSGTTVESGVMLQGFNWNSANNSSGWYNVMKNNADSIKNTFEYVWCPPPSDAGSDQGYLPRKLNVLTSKYGSAAELTSMISSISPAKAIADVVINHRNGTSNWGTFTEPSFCADYYAICSDDEGFSSSGSDMYGSSNRGNPDSGESYGAARDLDHTNTDVQNGIKTWMNNVLKNAGFVGWRYDFVKGYAGKYVGMYDAATSAEFSVGEHWPTQGYSSSNPSAWGNELKSWVNATEQGGYRSKVFDFTLKGAMNTVFGNKGSGITNSNYSLLNDSSNICMSYPEDAVTFVDNHDTGSTQAHWYLDPDDVGTAYALILTHPGYPCVAWQHYFTSTESSDSGSQYVASSTVSGTSNTLRQHIDQLIGYRKYYGIEYDSTRTCLAASSSVYAALIEGAYGNLITAIGNGYNTSDSSYELLYNGTDFKIWGKLNNINVTFNVSDTWIWDNDCTIFAKATTPEGTSWISCTGKDDSTSTAAILKATIPSRTKSLTLYRCPSDTTTATVEEATKHNTSNAISVNCKTLTYNVTWN